ncbi:hypothetical protein Q8A73_000496 [Channa argus]|nr:hypothetical protein Q8A73_000496 [Channa argus]
MLLVAPPCPKLRMLLHSQSVHMPSPPDILPETFSNPYLPPRRSWPHIIMDFDTDAMDPSAAATVQRCQLPWQRLRQSLLRSVSSYEKWANKRHSPARQYAPGQKVWLSTMDFHLQVPLALFIPSPFPKLSTPWPPSYVYPNHLCQRSN